MVEELDPSTKLDPWPFLFLRQDLTKSQSAQAGHLPASTFLGAGVTGVCLQLSIAFLFYFPHHINFKKHNRIEQAVSHPFLSLSNPGYCPVGPFFPT